MQTHAKAWTMSLQACMQNYFTLILARMDTVRIGSRDRVPHVAGHVSDRCSSDSKSYFETAPRYIHAP